MKKFIAILCMTTLFSLPVEARRHNGYHHHDKPNKVEYHYIAPKKHHNASEGEAIALAVSAGIIGIAWIANLFSSSNN